MHALEFGDDLGLRAAQNVLVQPAHEGQARTVLLPELDDIHARGGLHRVHKVEPGIEEGVDDPVHVAVGVLAEDTRATVLQHIPDAPVVGLDELEYLLRAGQGAALACHILME